MIRSVEKYHDRVDGHFRSIAFWKGFFKILPWALAVICCLIFLLVLYAKRAAAIAAHEKAQRKLAVWENALSGKLFLLRELNEKKTKEFGAKRSDLQLEGADLELAHEIIDKIGRSRILINLANNTLSKVKRVVYAHFVGSVSYTHLTLPTKRIV